MRPAAAVQAPLDEDRCCWAAPALHRAVEDARRRRLDVDRALGGLRPLLYRRDEARVLARAMQGWARRVLCGRAFAALRHNAQRAAQLGRVCRRRPLRRAFDALAACAALRLARRRALVSALCIALARIDRLALGRAFDTLAAEAALRCAALRVSQRGALAGALRAADRQRGARRSALLLHGLRQIRRNHDAAATRRAAAALLHAAQAALEAGVRAALAGVVRHWAAQATAVAAMERKRLDDERASKRAAKALAEDAARRAAVEDAALQRIAHATRLEREARSVLAELAAKAAALSQREAELAATQRADAAALAAKVAEEAAKVAEEAKAEEAKAEEAKAAAEEAAAEEAAAKAEAKALLATEEAAAATQAAAQAERERIFRAAREAVDRAAAEAALAKTKAQADVAVARAAVAAEAAAHAAAEAEASAHAAAEAEASETGTAAAAAAAALDSQRLLEHRLRQFAEDAERRDASERDVEKADTWTKTETEELLSMAGAAPAKLAAAAPTAVPQLFEKATVATKTDGPPVKCRPLRKNETLRPDEAARTAISVSAVVAPPLLPVPGGGPKALRWPPHHKPTAVRAPLKNTSNDGQPSVASSAQPTFASTARASPKKNVAAAPRSPASAGKVAPAKKKQRSPTADARRAPQLGPSEASVLSSLTEASAWSSRQPTASSSRHASLPKRGPPTRPARKNAAPGSSSPPSLKQRPRGRLVRRFKVLSPAASVDDEDDAWSSAEEEPAAPQQRKNVVATDDAPVSSEEPPAAEEQIEHPPAIVADAPRSRRAPPEEQDSPEEQASSSDFSTSRSADVHLSDAFWSAPPASFSEEMSLSHRPLRHDVVTHDGGRRRAPDARIYPWTEASRPATRSDAAQEDDERRWGEAAARAVVRPEIAAAVHRRSPARAPTAVPAAAKGTTVYPTFEAARRRFSSSKREGIVREIAREQHLQRRGYVQLAAQLSDVARSFDSTRAPSFDDHLPDFPDGGSHSSGPIAREARKAFAQAAASRIFAETAASRLVAEATASRDGARW
ncbi:hypothetical protein M885DRAFT_612109 [Pelagophyceae sp. CCMP2097]|nr:hypothetical protein M885DRAFT_612109 [Pelagophyceae sp. CCMP2097]